MSVVVFPLPRSLTHDDAHTVSAAIAQALAQAQAVTSGAATRSVATAAQAGEGSASTQKGGGAEMDRCLRLDAHAVAHIDSAALAVVLQAQRDAKAQGWTVTVTPIPPRLLQLAQMYGVAELLGWSN
jgi:phospholipid transport system transporter-binding protein